MLQSASSNLFQFRGQLRRGLAYPGPALFSVFSGASGTTGELPPYLVAAAAMDSRAFPAFTYDPSAGSDWASRFDLQANPDVGQDWPVRSFHLRRRGASKNYAGSCLYAGRSRRLRSPLRAAPGARAARRLGGEHAPGRGMPCPGRYGVAGKCSLPPDGWVRRHVAEGHRRREADARSSPLPRDVAQPAGTRGHPQLPCRAPARPRAQGA